MNCDRSLRPSLHPSGRSTSVFVRVAVQVVEVFPLPILRVVLLFEGLVLMRLVGDTAGSPRELTIALLVAVVAMNVPQGYVVGLLIGMAMYYLAGRLQVHKS